MWHNKSQNRVYRMMRIIVMSLVFFWQIHRLLRKERRQHRPLPKHVWDKLWRAQAKEFRKTALELEGMMIKLGQFLSSRADLLPQSCIEELEQLQDRITPVAFPVIQQQLVQSYDGDLSTYFQTIEQTPIAAASLGQVHKGILSSGECVAIKVQRPHIARMIRTDLLAIRIVISIIQKSAPLRDRIDLYAIYDEVQRTTFEELDYHIEAAHLEQFTHFCAQRTGIKVPRLFAQLTRKHVLVMEYMVGAKINDLTFMEEHNIDPGDVAKRFIEAFLAQVMYDGFFHADPHAGNVWIDEKGQLIFLDFGMMGHIDQPNRDGLRHFLRAIVDEDARQMLYSLREMGVIVLPDADIHALLQSLRSLMTPYFENQTPDLITNEMIQGILIALQTFVYEQPMQLPYHLTFLGRAAGIVAGLSTEIEPTVPYLAIIQPYLSSKAKGNTKENNTAEAEHTKTDHSSFHWAQFLQSRGLLDWIRVLYRLWSPLHRLSSAVSSTFEQFGTGHLRLEKIHDHTILRTFHRVINRLAWFSLMIFFAVESFEAYLHRQEKEAAIGTGLALIFLIAAMRNSRQTEALFKRDSRIRK